MLHTVAWAYSYVTHSNMGMLIHYTRVYSHITHGTNIFSKRKCLKEKHDSLQLTDDIQFQPKLIMKEAVFWGAWPLTRAFLCVCLSFLHSLASSS